MAINVILLHIFGVPSLGNYSVSFFFILSGFLMTHIMQNTYGYNLNGVKKFWINRVLRLYPIYWIILILTVLLIFIFKDVVRNESMFIPTNFGSWISNLSIIYPNLIPHRINPRLIPPSWALTNELVFYLLISLGISKTRTRTFLWLLLGILYFVFTYFYKTGTWRYSAIPASSLPFAIGATLYWINMTLSKIKSNVYLILFLYLLFCLNALHFGSDNIFIGETSIYINYIIASLMILQLFNFETDKKNKKIDSYVGYFSYPFYLSHDLIFILSMLLGFDNLPGQARLPMIDLLPYFIILFIFCFILVYFVDIKVDNYKKRSRGISFMGNN